MAAALRTSSSVSTTEPCTDTSRTPSNGVKNTQYVKPATESTVSRATRRRRRMILRRARYSALLGLRFAVRARVDLPRTGALMPALCSTVR